MGSMIHQAKPGSACSNFTANAPLANAPRTTSRLRIWNFLMKSFWITSFLSIFELSNYGKLERVAKLK